MSADMAHFNTIYMTNILKLTYAFANLAHHGEVIPILPQFQGPIGTFDSTRVPHIIEAGIHATEEKLPYLRRLLREQ